MELGVLFFFACLFLWILVKAITGNRARPGQTESDGARVKCAHCAELIMPDAKICRYCGRDVVPVAQARPANAIAAQPAELGPAGQTDKRPTAPETIHTDGQGPSWWTVILVFLLVAIFLGVVALLVTSLP